MSKVLIIKEVIRETDAGERERLTFGPGVNVLVGRPNTGKTKWLETIDYLFGDDGSVEEKLGDDLAEKYASASVVLSVGGDDLVLSRRWKERGSKTKVFVGEEAHTLESFQSFLLEVLGIPEVSFPQGNPYGARSWPTLRYRSLLRHIYRRQPLWGDLADRQPASEAYACVAQFVGVADTLFSQSYADLVAKEKRITELENRRETYISVLTEVSRDVGGETMEGVAVTPAGLSAAAQQLASEIEALSARRDRAVEEAMAVTSQQQEAGGGNEERLSAHLVALRAEREEAKERLDANARTRDDTARYRQLATDELGRLRRARQASDVLGPLHVTHCPACSQEILRKGVPAEGKCVVCHQQTPPSRKGADARVEFEIEQLSAEVAEADSILSNLAEDDEALGRKERAIREEIISIEQQLRPTRRAVLAILPPDVLVVDSAIGKRQAELLQLQRIEASLAKREEIAAQVQAIRAEVAALRSEVEADAAGIDFGRASDRLSDGMNEYVRSLRLAGEPAWTQADISISFGERSLAAKIGGAAWRGKVGGTLSLYFLLSYHYSLMKLVTFEGNNYPGYCILDLPAEMEGTSVADKENFILKPFVKLLGEDGFPEVQLVVAGSAFDGIEGATRVELDTVWR